ncbi:Trp biosynthesis-associated membrane protein [Nocardioides panacis]|uniref:Trp biosynthesis-associated membrane protein n=1 Tax=Nocardioides panacis TaxID=2849501 RepID=A0A975Y280_9ACTN|nr:Trp biosynthesis-associated membrane protein [Nocardioides panacis]QWZ10281.1 Trp biosynthesis-associated membrane protein [Nocardioides panacis]
MAERPRSRSFGPVVLLGLGGAALAAVAGAHDWARTTGSAAGTPVTAVAKGSESAPLVVALALVALAAWGVVLVVRLRTRRVVSVLGVLASAGALAATLASHGRAQADSLTAVMAKGASGADAFSTAVTGWYYAAAVGGLLSTVAFVLALLWAPRWPAMGSRYDAPAAQADARATAPVGEQDMWRALDDGRDPTA